MDHGTSGRTTVNSVGVRVKSGRVPSAIVGILPAWPLLACPSSLSTVPILVRSPGSTARCWIGRSTPPPTGLRSAPEDGQCIAFHRVADYTPPTWPTQERPKQMHLDMLVDDLDAAEAAVIDLGASHASSSNGDAVAVAALAIYVRMHQRPRLSRQARWPACG